MTRLYELRRVKHRYTAQPALNIEHMSIRSGSITGLIGPNGSGKSTLLNLLAFLEKPSEGQIRYHGQPTEPFSERVRSRVTLLTQEPYLMKRSVFKNISYGLSIRNDTHDLRRRVYDAMSLAGLPGEAFAVRRWFELSMGEAQRVALAARLILKPEVLLLDEPTASVDAASVQIIKDTALMARNQWGTTLVIASHDWEWLYGICDDVCHLFRGRIFGTGRENFIFGPWIKTSTAHWGKQLGSGKYLLVTPPPHSKAVALLNPELISITVGDQGPNDGRFCVDGILTRLLAEKGDERILAIVQLGNLNISVRLKRKHAMDQQLFPGIDVRLRYHPADITWC